MNAANVSFLAAETGFLVWFAVRNASAWSASPGASSGGGLPVRRGPGSISGAASAEAAASGTPLAAFADWPDTFGAFCDRFATEEACAAFLRQVRFPAGFECPECGAGESRRAGTPRFIVCEHGHHTSLVGGSAMGGGSAPLVLWFRAAWLVANGQSDLGAMDLLATPGLSGVPQPLGLRDGLRVLARTRAALACGEGASLRGQVELGFVTTRAPGGAAEMVAIARERRLEGAPAAGRMVIRLLDEPTSVGMLRFVTSVVAADATLLVDNGAVWSGLEAWERRILPRNEARSEEMAVALGEVATAMRGLGNGWLRRVEAQDLLDACAAAWNRVGDPAVAFCRSLSIHPAAVGGAGRARSSARCARVGEAVAALHLASLGSTLLPG